MTQRYDRILIVLVAILILVGLTAVYSSTSVVSPAVAEKQKGKGIEASQFSFIKKQLLTVVMGLVILFIACKVPLEYLRKAAIPLLVLSLIFLVLVYSPLGMSAGGARRWLRLWPSAFQPSELVKLAMVLFMAWYMSRPEYRKERFVFFIIPIIIMGVFQVIILQQPDFGAAVSLAILTLSMLFLGGVRLRFLAMLGLLAVPLVIKLISEPYRWKRVAAFLDPWKDPQGSGFQLVQSFIALGSGGLIGVGLGESKQKLAFLPEVHTDFIFSLIGEELGFFGATIVVALFFVFFLQAVNIARKREDRFAHYLAFGIAIMIAVQAVINFAVVTGMVPTKGLPLPFISYGGSSLVVNMFAVGMLLNISKNAPVSDGRGLAESEAGAHALSGGESRWRLGFGYAKRSRTNERDIPAREDR
ncbi:MAG TPA: putative lipid II flippase FtsW [Dissulfurispiraceae bacterium]|nr:putative lipid II flippase FtsW [Dissulfurispiraceae bacterium]